VTFSYLDETNIFKRYDAAKRYTDTLTVPFPEFERIARNRPFEGIDPNYPNTTDGTTASIIRKTPRRVIQQLPTGSVITDDGGWLGVVADFIFNHKIIPHANEEYDLIQKCWTTVEGGLTFGLSVTYTPFINHDGEFSPDMTQVYWGDLAFQPGKKSLYSCNYVLMRSWWQKEDIEALIDKETKLAASAKKRGEKYDSTWDLKALKEIKDGTSTKDSQARTPIEDERGVDSHSLELVTGFQTGVGGKFYTFATKGEVIVRTETNKDPRGKHPLDGMYGDIDGSNVWGRGIVELVGGLQNLIDSDMQMYQYNRALMLAPPLIKYGNFNKSKVQFVPNAVIDVGSDPNAKVIPLTVDTSAVTNYPALYGLQKSQLLNLVNSPDTSTSATIGNPGFSKTSQGVQAQQAIVSVDDNYIRKMFEAWFEHWAETAVNLYFAKRQGIEELQLDKETAMRLRELPGFDESQLSPDNKIRIDYETETPALKFRVNPSTTSVKDQAAQVQDATQLLDLVMKYPMLNLSYGGPIDTEVLARRIVSNSGIDDPEQVAPEPTEAQKQSKEQQKNQVSPFSPMFDKPSIRMNYPDLPMAAQIQVLSNAGVHVTEQDLMQGPVVDPNMRGVMAPMSDPNALMPGQQPGQASQGAGTSPIDLGDIYKLTTDPKIKAQIEAMAGLQVDPTNINNQVTTNAMQHVAAQTGHVASSVQSMAPPAPAAPDAKAPTETMTGQETPDPMDKQEMEMPDSETNEPQEPTEPGQLTPEDMQIIQQLRQLGFSDSIIQQAMTMLEQGIPAQHVIQALTQHKANNG